MLSSYSILTFIMFLLFQIHYTARFADGIVFDSSYKRGRPLTMRIGVGKVVIFYFNDDSISTLIFSFDNNFCYLYIYKPRNY